MLLISLLFVGCILTFTLYLLLPFFFPSIINAVLYIVNLPLIVFLSVGSISFMSYNQDVDMLKIAMMNKEMYPPWALQISFFALFMYSLCVILCLLATSPQQRFTLPNIDLNSIPIFYLNRYILLLFFLLLLFCLPHWFVTGISKTGLYSLLTLSPGTYLFARESSIKLAESGISLSLYSYGVLIARFIYPLLCWRGFTSRFLSARFFYFIAFCLVSLIANIQGARAGFFEPIVISALTFFFCNMFGIRSKLIYSFSSLAGRAVLTKSLYRIVISTLAILFLVILLLVVVSLAASSGDFNFFLVQRMAESVLHRLFSVQFFTGPINIFLVDRLSIGWENFFGGFPGASFLLGNHQSIFALTGEYSEFYFNGISGDTNNLNTSGLFLQTAIWGFPGFAIYFVNIFINVYVFEKFSVRANFTRFKFFFLIPYGQLLAFNAAIVLAVMAWQMPSSVITVFPVMWVLALVSLIPSSMATYIFGRPYRS